MSTPRSAEEAGRVAARLLKRSLAGRPRSVRGECERGARVAAAIWTRWQVGPWQWQCKHVRWFLEHRTTHYGDWTRYRYWLTVERLLKVTGKADNWRPRLEGAWCRPSHPV